MTRVATSASEADLLGLARSSTAAQLERICRYYRQARQPDPDSRSADDDRRWVVARQTDDGMVSIQLRLHPDEAARVMRALEHCADRGSLADGAVALADTALSGTSEGQGVARPPVEIVIHVDAATLEGTTEVGDGLSAETSRRLLCDAGVVPLLEDGSGKTIDVGRKTRTIPAALRRALNARDKHCRWPGCSHRRLLDAHHIRHWVDGGETSLSNSYLTCRRHHILVHEHGFSVQLRDGELVFLDPGGREILPVPPRPRVDHGALDWLRAASHRRGIDVSAESNLSGWDGWPVDYDACVGAIGGWN